MAEWQFDISFRKDLDDYADARSALSRVTQAIELSEYAEVIDTHVFALVPAQEGEDDDE